MNDREAAPFVPAEAAASLHLLGTSETELPVSLERLWENVLDWEHVSYVHHRSFTSCRLIARGRWWWSAHVGRRAGDQVSTVVIDPERVQWGIRIDEGPNAGALIHLQVTELGPRLVRVAARFLTPVAPRNDAVRRAMHHFFAQQFHQILAEDGAMMERRQEAFDRLDEAGSEADLGGEDDVRRRLPFVVTWRGSRFWVHAADDALHALSADCPHQLLPLPAPEGTGPVVCPFHGFAFDPATGRSCDGRNLKLRAPPAVVVRDGRVHLA